MVKAELIIKNNVQDVGYRLFVMERILESPLQGGAINQSDGTVKVLLEGQEHDIFAFVEKLKKEFPELAKNPTLIGPRFDETIVVPNEMRLSQSLQLNQFSKAVVYLERLSNDIKSGFEKLPREIAKAIKES